MQRNGMSNNLMFERHVSQQNLADYEMDLELFGSAKTNSFSISTDNEDFIAESTEDGSFTTAKSDNFSLLDEDNIMMESHSTRDANLVARNYGGNDDFSAYEAKDSDSKDNSLEQCLILQGLRMDEWNFSESDGAIIEDQFTIPSTEVPKSPPLPSSFGAFEVDNRAHALVREKIFKAQAEKRAFIWDCCGFWSWSHPHKD